MEISSVISLAGRRVILEELILSQLVKKFFTIYGTRRFITVFTKSHRHVFSTVYLCAFRSALGPTQPPLHWVPGALPQEM